jgi:U4/U6.U5 tri-snRNP-associated protein 2
MADDRLSPSALQPLIHREFLDFDDDFRCSVTLSTENLYVCLTCGRCFSGGSQRSPLIEHFFSSLHSLVMKVSDFSFVTLPGLDRLPDFPDFFDIKFSANPVYDRRLLSFVRDNSDCGFYGLETLNPSPGRIAILRFLSTIEPLRDLLLLEQFEEPILSAFSWFYRHFFNPFRLKKYMSPTKLLRLFPDSDDPFRFLCASLNELNRGLREPNVLSENVRQILSVTFVDSGKIRESIVWMLPLNLEDSPLYRTGLEKEEVIPRVHFEELLRRYDGATVFSEVLAGQVVRKTFKVQRAAKFLIFNLNRIRKNEFSFGKSRIHVTLPFENLSFAGRVWKLRAIVAHEGEVDAGFYLSFVYNRVARKWFKCQSLDITEVLPEVAGTAQCCFLLFEAT